MDWIQVEDGLPDTGKVVLIAERPGGETLITLGYFDAWHSWTAIGYGGRTYCNSPVTHWQPIAWPEPPEEEESHGGGLPDSVITRLEQHAALGEMLLRVPAGWSLVHEREGWRAMWGGNTICSNLHDTVEAALEDIVGEATDAE